MSKIAYLLCLLFFLTAILCGCRVSPQLPEPGCPTDGPPSMTLVDLPGDLISLSFSESSSYFKRVQGYDFHAEDGKYTAYFWLANEEEPYFLPVDQAWVDTLTGIVRQHNMLAWDGFRETDSILLDGTSFSISLAFSDGTAVHASGYGQFPEGYGTASEAIDAHFMQLLPEEMRGW